MGLPAALGEPRHRNALRFDPGVFPVVFGWRATFSETPGKLRTILYFACLGIGYIMVEVGLIAHFILALSNATVSASILITGMLVAQASAA